MWTILFHIEVSRDFPHADKYFLSLWAGGKINCKTLSDFPQVTVKMSGRPKQNYVELSFEESLLQN